MSPSSSQPVSRFTTALDAALAGAPESAANTELRAAARALLAAHGRLEALLEARDEQVELQRAMIASIGCPMLQVRADTLCVPVVGELDTSRTMQLGHELLGAVVRRRVAVAVLDLTGAVVHDETVVLQLRDVLQALELVGVAGVLCGIQPDLAVLLAGTPDALRGVHCFTDLASALAAPAAGLTRKPGS